MVEKNHLIRSVVIAILFCSHCISAEPEKKVPFKGDEIPLVRIKASPTEYVGKVFTICGGIKVYDYFNYEYSDAQHTHYSLRFVQVGKDSQLKNDDATLYLSRKVGAPIINKLLAKEEDTPSNNFALVRVKVTILPQRYDSNAWEMFELLDIQFPNEDWKGWDNGVLARIAGEKRRELETQVANAKADELAAKETGRVAAAKRRELSFRTWTSTAGTTIEARFAGLSGGKVTLEKRDGKKIRVPLDKLSDVDQKFIADKRKR